MRPSDITRLHTLGAPVLSPNGRYAVVAVTRPDLDADAYRGGLWRVDTGGSAEPRPLTGGARDSAPAFSPDGRFIAFLRAEDDAPAQVYVLPADGGAPWRVTDRPLGVTEFAWAPDSARLAFVARVPEEGRYGDTPAGAEPPRRITTLQYRLDGVGFTTDRRPHVFVTDLGSHSGVGAAVRVTEDGFDHSGIAWSPDGALLAFTSARHATRDSDLVSDVWVCAPDGTGPRALTRTDLAAEQPRFTPDGRTVCFTATETGADRRSVFAENTGLWTVPVDGSAPPRRLTSAEDVTLGRTADIVPTAEGVLFPAENRGAVELLEVPYDGGAPRVLVGGPREVQSAARAAGTTVAVVADGRSTGELLRVDAAGEHALTAFGAGPDPLSLEEVTATAEDGYPVHGWLVRPEGPGPHPVLLMIHGGPFTQYGWQVFDEAQVYAGAGYAVVMGNPRGSSGYGRAHGAAIAGDVGRVSARDLTALLDAALERGGLDAGRMGVLGGSHGGYMTGWMAAHHGDRFRAAISERAVNAIDSFHGSSDIGWYFAADVYGPDPAGWVEQSPLTHADAITIPTLIIHSEEDWRCPVEQAQRLFVALRLRGVEAELLLFPGEGHELSRSGRPSHRVARFEAILDWWSRHL
jgi:dipeptidyl aminopeptidase/acylaminoacyl peptidase